MHALGVLLVMGANVAGAPASKTIPYAELAERLRVEIEGLDLAHLEPGYQTLCQRHGLDPETSRLRDEYRKARVLFEGVRDGGFFRLRWAVTNQEPTSKKIWEAWQGRGFSISGPASATAECDELSTLYAFLGRSVGVRKLGVFYPTWNHAIAAWEPKRKDGKSARVLIPTSQIFLECEHTFDQTSFSTKVQRTVFEYTNPDVRPRAPVSRAVADALVEQVRVYGGASEDLSALLRLHRAERFGSSTQPCRALRATLAARVAAALHSADSAALAAYATTELAIAERDPRKVLALLE